MSSTPEPLISLKEAGRLLGLDLNAVRRLVKKRRGVRLEAVKVSDRRYHTKASWVAAYIAQLNPPAAELDPESVKRIRAIDPRKAANIDRRLAAKGYFGADKKREVLGVSKAR